MRNFVRKIKLTIINDDQNDRKIQYQSLRNYQYHSWKLANKIVQGQFFLKVFEEMLLFKNPDSFEKFKKINKKIQHLNNSIKTIEVKNELKNLYNQILEIKNEHKEEFETFLRNQSIQNFTYSSNVEDYSSILPSTIRTTLNAKVYSEFNNKYKEFQKGIASIQSYKRTISVPFQKKSLIDLKCEEDGSYTFTLFKIKFKCLLGKDLNNTKHILDELIKNTGKFILGDSAYSFNGNELFLIANLKTSEIKSKQNPNIIAGIDLGITRMATLVIRDINSTSTTNYVERKYYGDNSFMKKVNYLKNHGSNLSRYTLGKTGKGKLHAIGKKQDFLKKMGNFRDSYNKKIAHNIIQRCINNNVSLIVMEDLSGIANRLTYLKDWPYFDLQTKIKNKALEYGIEVQSNPPEYTSETCPNCGYVHEDNRKTQKDFFCVKCEYKNNADVTASINLINFAKGISIQKKRIKKLT